MKVRAGLRAATRSVMSRPELRAPAFPASTAVSTATATANASVTAASRKSVLKTSIPISRNEKSEDNVSASIKRGSEAAAREENKKRAKGNLKVEEEMFEIFSPEMKLIGTERRSVVHSKGLLHRSVNVLIFNPRGELLLQKRADDKDVCPGMWDLSCAEHLKPGESFLQAALRGLKEELDICAEAAHLELGREVQLLKWRFNNGKVQDHEFSSTYVLKNYDGLIQCDGVEVHEARWLPFLSVQRALQVQAEAGSPHFEVECGKKGLVTKTGASSGIRPQSGAFEEAGGGLVSAGLTPWLRHDIQHAQDAPWLKKIIKIIQVEPEPE